MQDLLYGDISQEILEAYDAVYRNLGDRRYVYSVADLCTALTHELRRRGRQVQTQVTVRHRYRQHQLPDHSTVDLLVDDKIAVSVKQMRRSTPTHLNKLRGQLLAGGWAVGLVLNFGGASQDYQRCYEKAHDPTRKGGAV